MQEEASIALLALARGWGEQAGATGTLGSIYLLISYLIKAHNDTAICSRMPWN